MAENQHLDLSLGTNWFREYPDKVEFLYIPELQLKKGQHAHGSSSYKRCDDGTKTHYIVFFSCRWINNLSRNFVKLHWTSVPSDPPTAVQRYFDPPQYPITPGELNVMAADCGAKILQFCDNLSTKANKMVGKGECSDLTRFAIDDLNLKRHVAGQSLCMQGLGNKWGYEIFLREGGNNTNGALGDVKLGDIIQFLQCTFPVYDAQDQPTSANRVVGPSHTAVIRGLPAQNNGFFAVWHQNAGGVKDISQGKYNVSHMTGGTLWIYRPITEQWGGVMEPSFPWPNQEDW